jgi:hypothetical protein
MHGRDGRLVSPIGPSAHVIAALSVGTLVTGTSELALHTHANFLTWASVSLYALLIVGWLTVATRVAT